MAAAGTAARLRFAGIAVLVFTLTYAIASILAIPRSTEPFTTYAGATYAHASTAAHAADLAAGLGLLAAGLLAWVGPRTRRVGVLALLAGIAWFGPDWEGWDGGPPVRPQPRRRRGAVLPRARLPPRARASATGGSASAAVPGRGHRRLRRVAAFVSVGRALFRDPFLDPYCWRNCHRQLVPRPRRPGARARPRRRLGPRGARDRPACSSPDGRLAAATASGPARRVLLPVLVPGLLVGAAASAYAVALLRTPLEDPRRAPGSPSSSSRSVASRRCARARARVGSPRDPRAREPRSRAARGRARRGAAPGHARDVRSPRRWATRRSTSATGFPRRSSGSSTPGHRPDVRRLRARSGGDADRPRRSPARGRRPRRRAARRGRARGRRSARRRGSRSRTSGCRPRCSPSSRSCARRARGSSRPATPSGGGSSATSTTARSSACSRSPTTCASPARGRGRDGGSSARCSSRGATRPTRGARRAARARARHLPGDPRRGRASAPALATLADERAAPGRARRRCRPSASRRRSRRPPTSSVAEAIDDAGRARSATLAVSVARATPDELVVDGRRTTAAPPRGARARRRPRRRARRHARARADALRAEIPCA